jgi:hypothetical protein
VAAVIPRHVWQKRSRSAWCSRTGRPQPFNSNACPDILQFRQPPDAVVVLGRIPSTEEVNAMLLNEFLKEHRNVAEQQSTITELKATVAQQQKQIEALTATVRRVSE